jgi:ABC-type multidrug transport system fused ATPase/permease subunit
MSENRHNMNHKGPGGRRGGHGPGGFGRPVEKPKDFKGTFKRLVSYLKPHRTNLIVVLIFAIASTSFTIAAPKIMSKAMNKLQDTYMVRKMLPELSKGQDEAASKISEKMGDAQKQVIDQIDSKMVEGQTKAVDEISKNMADAQVSAVNSIYKAMAIQIYNGAASGQKIAVDKICTEMGAVQKQLLSQMQKMQQGMNQGGMQPGMQGAAPQQIDPGTLSAMQSLMKLPVIDTIKDKNEKVKAVIQFIDILQSMPQSLMQQGKMDAKTLSTLKELLSLPMLDNVKNPSERLAVVKKFMALSKNMPGGTASQGSTMNLDENTMNKAISMIPEIRDFKVTSSSTQKMDKSALDAVQKLLKLPMLKDIKDPKKKSDTLIKLIDIFKSMPDMSGSGSAANKINSKDLETVKELVSLPAISSIKDPAARSAAVAKMVDLFGKMPDMGTGNKTTGTSQVMTKDQLKSVQKLLKLPMLSSITDPAKKADVLNQMLDIFSSMPDMKSLSGKTSSNQPKMDSKSIKSIKDFISLPRLSTLTDANQKADVCRKIIDLSKNMQSAMDNTAANPKSNVKFTDSQINSVIKAVRETNGQYDFKYIGHIISILIGMYIISSLFSLVMGLVMSGVAQETVRDLRREVDEKLSRLPLKYYDMHSHGDILSRVTNDVDTIATTLQQSITQVITSIITIIGYIIMMLTISPVLTLIVIATMPLYVIATTFIAKKSQKYFAAQQKYLGSLSGHVEEMYTGHNIVKAFGHEKDSIEEFEAINSELKDAGWKAQFISGIMYPLMNFISNLGYVGISIVGGIWITKSILGLGDILAFIQYSRSFTMPIVQTANIANVIQSTLACAERVFEILDEKEEIPDSPDAVVIENPKGDVKFEHVAFRYMEDVPLIEDMNIDVKEGHTIAIVGPTGAGKTTLINLLMRFYEINAGKISVDGIDTRNIKRSELRKMFGMVLQDTWLYNGTIKENIAYGKEGATMDEIVRAAKAAHADHFIRTLPQGYDTVLNEEATNISQGQKQLLTIARAILADPAMLILDEATSSVDTRTEVLIQRAMEHLMKGRTSFVIAHRLSTIRDAELILVMNNGSIIEMGNHKELLKKGGFYSDLYNSQFKGANLDAEAI